MRIRTFGFGVQIITICAFLFRRHISIWPLLLNLFLIFARLICTNLAIAVSAAMDVVEVILVRPYMVSAIPA